MQRDNRRIEVFTDNWREIGTYDIKVVATVGNDIKTTNSAMKFNLDIQRSDLLCIPSALDSSFKNQEYLVG